MCFGKKPKPEYASSGGYSQDSIRPLRYVHGTELVGMCQELEDNSDNFCLTAKRNMPMQAYPASLVSPAASLFSEDMSTTRVLFQPLRLDSIMTIHLQDPLGKLLHFKVNE